MSQSFIVEYAESGSAAERERFRSDHIAYRRSLGAALRLAGSLPGDGQSPGGSVVIVDAADSAEAESLATGDPYVREGVLALVSVRPIRIAYVAAA